MSPPGRPKGEYRNAKHGGDLMSPRGLPGDDPMAAVEVWREQGAAQVDPVGFAVIEALARRAAAQQGEARRRLILRVDALLAQYAAAKPPARQAATAPHGPEARRAVLAGLSDLVDRLGRSTTSGVRPPSLPRKGAVRQNAAPTSVPLSHAVAPASRNAVTAFKGTWSRLRAEQRLRQALAQVPAMAGPLNSSHVINNTLQAMRDLSPEYLDAFMLHIDTLLWLEQASGGGLSLRAATPAEGGRGPGARVARKA